MTQNMLIGIGTMLVCIVIQCLGVSAVLYYVKALLKRDKFPTEIWSFCGVIMIALVILMTANMLQVAVWAQLFKGLGEIEIYADAFYHSAVNFSSLGYGDIVMSEERRLLGALEAGNGVLMFGLTTSVLFGLIQAFLRRKFEDAEELRVS